jgi:hypothetical protein
MARRRGNSTGEFKIEAARLVESVFSTLKSELVEEGGVNDSRRGSACAVRVARRVYDGAPRRKSCAPSPKSR